MPDSYAHYRFGQRLIATLPPAERRLAQHFRQLFLTGLQGPDPFYYHNPLFKTKAGKLGDKFHHQTGREFFNHACTCLNSDAARAYLLGLLAHYCLDSVCHPFVHAQSADGKIRHPELESEFDRFLMKLDGIEVPHTYDRGAHIRLTRGECMTAAAFFPPVTPGELGASVKNMAFFLRKLATPKPGTRNFLRKLLSVPGGDLRHHMMPERKNPNCAHLNEPLLALFDQALELYPHMLQQISDHLQHGAAFGVEFDPDFG